MNTCPALFHAIYPYVMTITEGGWFTWVKRNGGVVVGCPEGRVLAKIYHEKIELKVKSCPRHKNDEILLLSEFRKPDC